MTHLVKHYGANFFLLLKANRCFLDLPHLLWITIESNWRFSIQYLGSALHIGILCLVPPYPVHHQCHSWVWSLLDSWVIRFTSMSVQGGFIVQSAQGTCITLCKCSHFCPKLLFTLGMWLQAGTSPELFCFLRRSTFENGNINNYPYARRFLLLLQCSESLLQCLYWPNSHLFKFKCSVRMRWMSRLFKIQHTHKFSSVFTLADSAYMHLKAYGAKLSPFGWKCQTAFDKH